jgi:peptidoglycan LD-endopeptidase CwlK
MYKFSQSSLEKLSTCHEDLQVLAHECLKYRDVIILEGHRNEAAQNKAFAEGNSKLKWPNGNHNSMPSMAMDMGYWPNPYGNMKDALYFSGWVMGLAQMLYNIGKMKHKIRNGADWNQNGIATDESFQDTFHFEIINP